MDIFKLLEVRKKYPIGSKTKNVNEIDYIVSQLESKEDVIGIVLPVSFLNRKNSDISTLKELIFDDWHVLGIFDLSKIWAPYSGVDFNLICLGRHKLENIVFSKYEGSSTFSADRNRKSIAGEIGSQIITEEYLLYLEEVSNIIKNCSRKFFKSKGSMFVAPSNLLNHEHLSVNYYHPDLIENQNKLDQESTKLLSEVAEILVPRQQKGAEAEKCLVLSAVNFDYPIRLDKLKKGKKTNILLRKGDILLSKFGDQKIFLINNDLGAEIYPSTHTFLIRVNSSIVCPEYLFLYLKSDTANKYVLRYQMGAVINLISKKYLDLLPIIVPEKTVLERSKNLFKTLFDVPKEDVIEKINSELFVNSSPTKPIQIEFIEEFIKKSKEYKLKLIKRIIDDDLLEIQRCFNIKAYKAAIILSGSVLEAFLIDWLSEINKINYLASDADLLLFDMIKELDAKGYFDKKETNAAHNIRNQRNLIHPKKYLNSKVILDENAIIKTISDLKKILEKRL